MKQVICRTHFGKVLCWVWKKVLSHSQDSRHLSFDSDWVEIPFLEEAVGNEGSWDLGVVSEGSRRQN